MNQQPEISPPVPTSRLLRVLLVVLCLMTAVLFYAFVAASPSFQQMFEAIGDGVPEVTRMVLGFAPFMKVPLAVAWLAQLLLTAATWVTKNRAVAQGTLTVAILNLLSGGGLVGSFYLPLISMS